MDAVDKSGVTLSLSATRYKGLMKWVLSLDIKERILPISRIDTIVAPELWSENIEQQETDGHKIVCPITVGPRVYVAGARLTVKSRTEKNGIRATGYRSNELVSQLWRKMLSDFH